MTQDPTQQGREVFEKWYRAEFGETPYFRGKIVHAEIEEQWRGFQGAWQAQQSTIDALNKRVSELEGALNITKSVIERHNNTLPEYEHPIGTGFIDEVLKAGA